MRPTLERAILARGATLKDGGYQDTFGEYGEFIPQMYGRTGDACDECGTIIQRGVLGASQRRRAVIIFVRRASRLIRKTNHDVYIFVHKEHKEGTMPL